MTDEKLCKKCGETKPLELFSRDRSRPDGRRNACKACDVIHDARPDRVATRAEYSKTDASRAAWRKYGQSKKGLARASAKRERERHDPEKRRRRVTYTLRYQRTPKGQASLRQRMAGDSYKRSQQRWKAQNIDKTRAYTRHSEQRRLAMKRSLPATLTAAEWEWSLAYFEYRCAYCGAECALLHEHFIPLRHGGPYTAQNIVPACKLCNNRKRDKMPERWCAPDVYARVMAYFESLSRVT